LVFAFYQSLPPSTITLLWKKLWADIVAIPINDLQLISVISDVIERVAAETQTSSENLEIWCRGIDKEENIFHEMSDEGIINQVSSLQR